MQRHRPELFFPVGTTGNALVQISEAKVVCDECLVRGKCLDFALETTRTGVFGAACQKMNVGTFDASVRPSDEALAYSPNSLIASV